VGMIKEIKTVIVIGNKSPSVEDIAEAILYASENNCLVKIEWHIPYSGSYSRVVHGDSNVQEIKDSLPKVYGL